MSTHNSKKMVLLYLLLIFPFIKPGIINVLSALKIVDIIYDIWKLLAILTVGGLWFLNFIKAYKSKKFDKAYLFSLVTLIYFTYIFCVTVLKRVNLYAFLSQCGSLLALCFLVDICYQGGKLKELIEIILIILSVYIIINAITIIIFLPRGGIVSDIESVTMKKFNYFLGYDNQHVYFYIPYLTLSLFYNRVYRNRTEWITIIMHIVTVSCTFACWSADTIVAIVFFYVMLLVSQIKLIKKLINSYTIMIFNIICSCVLVLGLSSKNMRMLIQYVLHKNIGHVREGIWSRYIAYVVKSPIFGNGYIDAQSRYTMARASHAHNMYLDVLFIGGIVGLILFFGLIFVATNKGKEMTSREKMILIVGLCAYMMAFQATAAPFCPTFILMLAITYKLMPLKEVFGKGGEI